MHGIVDRAVAHALSTHLHDETRETEIRRALRKEFFRLLRSEARSIRGTSKRAFLVKLEREQNALLLRRDEARAELQALRDRVDFHRDLLAENHEDFARRVQAGAVFQEERLRGRLRELFEQLQAGEITQERFQELMGELTLSAARSERERLLEALSADHDHQVDLLERRVRKLSKSLEQSEAMLRHLESLQDVDEGVASIYRTVQGLSRDEPDAARKRVLLEEIFQANLELQVTAHSA